MTSGQLVPRIRLSLTSHWGHRLCDQTRLLHECWRSTFRSSRCRSGITARPIHVAHHHSANEGTGNRAQSARCLSSMHEDHSSIPRTARPGVLGMPTAIFSRMPIFKAEISLGYLGWSPYSWAEWSNDLFQPSNAETTIKYHCTKQDTAFKVIRGTDRWLGG